MIPSKSNNSYFSKECYSCKSVYGCLNCDNCKYNTYILGEEDRYEPHPLFYNSDVTKEDIIISDTNQVHNIQLKPNTIEINIPENVESITINFKKKSESLDKNYDSKYFQR